MLITLITERREIKPYGLKRGVKGQPGENFLIRKNNKKVRLASKITIECKKGESIEINSPGGGSWGFGRK